jgi:hypothetical protein
MESQDIFRRFLGWCPRFEEELVDHINKVHVRFLVAPHAVIGAVLLISSMAIYQIFSSSVTPIPDIQKVIAVFPMWLGIILIEFSNYLRKIDDGQMTIEI